MVTKIHHTSLQSDDLMFGTLCKGLTDRIEQHDKAIKGAKFMMLFIYIL